MEIPSGENAIIPPKSWTAQERWAWERILSGNPADFNAAETYGGNLDPRKPDGWDTNRVISPEFLETILFKEPFRTAITWQGVTVIGAWINMEINLSSGMLAFPLILYRCRFDAEVSFARLQSSHIVSLKGSKFAKLLSMTSMKIANDLLLGDQSEFLEIHLENSNIEGRLEFVDTVISGTLDMGTVKVGNGLSMSSKSHFENVSLLNARIDGSVYMNGSTFTGELNMDGITISGDLHMDEEGMFAATILRNANVSGYINLTGSTFDSKLNMNSVTVGGSIFIRDGAEFKSDLVLTGADVKGQLDVGGSKVAGELNLNHITTGADILMNKKDKFKTEFSAVDLRTAVIQGAISANGAKISTKLDMGSVKVSDNISLEEAEIANLDIHGSVIGGQLNLNDSKLSGSVMLEDLKIEGYLLMVRAKVTTETEINLKFSEFGAVNLTGSTLPSVDMTGTHVRGEFRICRKGYTTMWSHDANLRLRNAMVGALHDTENSWPPHLDLTGFTYGRLGGGEFAVQDIQDLSHRNVEWFRQLLERQSDYSPQPYEQLGFALLTAGAREKANEILYEGRNRERKEILSGWQWIYSTLLYTSVGYGYRTIRRTLFWIFVFTALGVIALTIAAESSTLNASFTQDFPSDYFSNISHRISYSLDKFLPLVKLRDYHFSRIRLDGWIGWYFDFHQLMGYLLGSLFIAGLTGLTRRSSS